MRSARLTLALQSGALTLPETGDFWVLRPRAEDDLSDLQTGRVVVVQGFRPDHDAFAGRGFRVFANLAAATEHSRPTAALVCLPRARTEARALIAAAATAVGPQGLVIVDGQKTYGPEAMLRDLRTRLDVSEPVSKAHGKLFSFTPGSGNFSDWAPSPQVIDGGFVTLPGVFSADAPDRGSLLLTASLPEKLGARVIDLGAGWGFLSRAVLTRNSVRDLHLVEAEADALDCARRNIIDPRAQFHWADATTFRLDRGVDTVVCNPPFHTTRDADPAIGQAFLAAAARLLASHGTLWLVANRHLPYDRTLATLFREVEQIGTDPAFRVIRAARPNRPKP